jgi:hypothetical protein
MPKIGSKKYAYTAEGMAKYNKAIKKKKSKKKSKKKA